MISPYRIHTISVSLRKGPDQEFVDSIVTMFGEEKDALTCFRNIQLLLHPTHDSWCSQADGHSEENKSPTVDPFESGGIV